MSIPGDGSAGCFGARDGCPERLRLVISAVETKRMFLGVLIGFPFLIYLAEQGDGFQPEASLCFLKCVLVQKGSVKYTGSFTSVVTTSRESPFGMSNRSKYSVSTASAL